MVHGLGKILHFLGEEAGATQIERECVLGEYSWVVGAPFPESIACPRCVLSRCCCCCRTPDESKLCIVLLYRVRRYCCLCRCWWRQLHRGYGAIDSKNRRFFSLSCFPQYTKSDRKRHHFANLDINCFQLCNHGYNGSLCDILERLVPDVH